MVSMGVCWVTWCTVHSILIAPSVTSFIQCVFPQLFRYYRLFYNGLSFVTLLPLIFLTHNMQSGPVVFSWEGYATSGRGLLLVMALFLFISAARHYDMHSFLGTRQAKTGVTNTLISERNEIFEGGIFAVTRHPWYLGSLLLIWSIFYEYTFVECLVGSILSIYLVIGSLLEERKIIAIYGDRYRRYQQKVSMLFPLKWISTKMRFF